MKIYGLIAALVISCGSGFLTGWGVQGWRMGEQIAEINRSTSETLKSIAVAAAQKQRELQNELDTEQAKWAAIEAEQFNLLRDAENETGRLRADVDAIRKRLFVNATCPTSSDNLPETGSSASVDNGSPPELNADARQDYYALRDGIERVTRQLLACQSRLR